MKKRITYSLIIILLLLVIHLLVKPYLLNQFKTNLITLTEYRLYYLAMNQFVTAILAIILMVEGKSIVGVREVSALIILNLFMDYNRIKVYPEIAIRGNAVTMFAGIIIFAFGLVAVKSAIYNKSAGIFFFILGAMYIFRFPVFIDVLFFTLKKYYEPFTASEKYFYGTIYINYIIIFLGLVALDRILKDNASMKRFAP